MKFLFRIFAKKKSVTTYDQLESVQKCNFSTKNAKAIPVKNKRQKVNENESINLNYSSYSPCRSRKYSIIPPDIGSLSTTIFIK